MQLHKPWVAVMASLLLISFQAISQDAQDEAIKKAIASETDALFKHDFNAWQSAWLQDDKTSTYEINMFQNRTRVGWSNIGPAAAKYVKENPSPDTVDVKTDSFNIR